MLSVFLKVLQFFADLGLRFAGYRETFVETSLGTCHAWVREGNPERAPLVVLHGIADSLDPLVPLLRALASEERTVIGLEMVGHGRSGKPAGAFTPETLAESTAGAVATLAGRPAILAGNSLGGWVSLRIALDHPGQVAGLYLTSPAGGGFENDAERLAFLDEFTFPDVEKAKVFLEKIYHPGSLPPKLFAGFVVGTFQQKHFQEFLKAARSRRPFTAQELGGLRAPVTVHWGQEERLMRPSNLAYFKSHLPKDTRFVEPPGHSHCPHLDDPRGLAQSVMAFAREC